MLIDHTCLVSTESHQKKRWKFEVKTKPHFAQFENAITESLKTGQIYGIRFGHGVRLPRFHDVYGISGMVNRNWRRRFLIIGFCNFFKTTAGLIVKTITVKLLFCFIKITLFALTLSIQLSHVSNNVKR